MHLNSEILSLRVFRQKFKNDYHLGFHLPKKDKCTFCESYKNCKKEEQLVLEQTVKYKSHISDKDISKKNFLADQEKSKLDPLFLCASFDLQKVLNTPHGKSINLYYSRKYSYYNESIYENGTRNGYCFLWGESDGKRGCNEISSIMYKYLTLVDQRKIQNIIHLYCDSCAGQNRNKIMLSMLTNFLKKSSYISNIKITFLLPGHTMMPVDSIHSTIESFIRNKTVWAPSEWPTLISNARSNPSSYECILMNYNDFSDWKKLSLSLFHTKCNINFKALRSASFEKNSSVILLKYGFSDDCEVKEYDTALPRPKRISGVDSYQNPELCYESKSKISRAKYLDLKGLCEKKLFPKGTMMNTYL